MEIGRDFISLLLGGKSGSGDRFGGLDAIVTNAVSTLNRVDVGFDNMQDLMNQLDSAEGHIQSNA